MAQTTLTILTTKNIPVDLTSSDYLKFTKGIKIGSNVLVDAEGNIPFGRISGSEGFQAIVTRITDIEGVIGDSETAGTIIKRLSVLEETDASHASSLTSLDTRITTNAGNITSLSATVTSQGNEIAAIKSAIGDATTPAAGTILKRINDIEETLGGSSSTSVAERLTAVETLASNNQTAIAAVNTAIGADDTTGLRKRIADVESDVNSLDGRLTTAENGVSTNASAITAINTAIGADDTTGLRKRIADVEGVIPSEASSSNKLADKAFVNSSIQTATAYFDGNWATVAAIPSTAEGYTEAGLPVPGPNNYLVVIADEDHNNQTWRYKYTGAAGVAYDKALWRPEYKINDTALTAAQLAALNSGITDTLVAKITANESAISSINAAIGDDATANTVKGRIKSLEDDLNTATTGLKARVTATESGVSANQSAIAAINTAIGADDTTGLRKRIADVEAEIGSDSTSGLKKRVKDIEDVVPYAASSSNELADKAFVNNAVGTVQNNLESINFLNLPATFKVGNRRYQITIDNDDNLTMTKLEEEA